MRLWLHGLLLGSVIGVPSAAGILAAQDTAVHQDTAGRQDTGTPTIEQLRYMEGLRTATRGVAQIRDGLNRVARTQQADSVTRRRAARRLGGLCGTARSFIASGRPKMKPTAYADSLRILAKKLTTRLDTLTGALPICEQTAARDLSTVVTALTTRLKVYDDALVAFRNAQAAFNKPDSAQ